MKVPEKAVAFAVDTTLLNADQMLELLGEFLSNTTTEGKRLWDALATVRGPDCGISAGPDWEDGRSPDNTKKREVRKAQTAMILRSRLFPKGVGGASAKFSKNPDALIILPAKKDWDHYDKHVYKTCQAFGFGVQVEGEAMPTEAFETWIYVEEDMGIQPEDDMVAGCQWMLKRSGSTYWLISPSGHSFKVKDADHALSAFKTPAMIKLQCWEPDRILFSFPKKGNPWFSMSNPSTWQDLNADQLTLADDYRVAHGINGNWSKNSQNLYTFFASAASLGIKAAAAPTPGILKPWPSGAKKKADFSGSGKTVVVPLGFKTISEPEVELLNKPLSWEDLDSAKPKGGKG